jgi:branched-chain amino acid aminotransferase
MFEHLKVWVNGKIIPWGQATVHIMSHSFSRGSAMFDVFGIHPHPQGPVAFRMDKHLDRLFRSAELLGFEMAYTKDDVAKAVAKLVKANNIGRGLGKIMAFYSEEAIISLVMESKLDLAVFAIPETHELGLDKAEPISICLSKWRKLHPATVPVEAKACANYLNGVLSRKDAAERGFDLAIMLTTDGYVAEGAIESVFMVKDGVVKTPPLGNVLQSVTRMSLLEAVPTLGIRTSEEQITPEEFLAADEIFTCHTGIKVTPVKRIEDRVLGEAPGPVTSKISELMKAICEFREDRFKDWFQPLG